VREKICARKWAEFCVGNKKIQDSFEERIVSEWQSRHEFTKEINMIVGR
jgi:hypothetical protein